MLQYILNLTGGKSSTFCQFCQLETVQHFLTEGIQALLLHMKEAWEGNKPLVNFELTVFCIASRISLTFQVLHTPNLHNHLVSGLVSAYNNVRWSSFFTGAKELFRQSEFSIYSQYIGSTHATYINEYNVLLI